MITTIKRAFVAAIWVLVSTVMLATSVAAENLTWGGGGTNGLASNPANWGGGVAPVAGDAIVLGNATNKNMTWNLNLPVQSWTQVGYLGTVTVSTVYGQTGFTNLTILGDCVLSNGVWTHNLNTTTESNWLAVMIGGNLIIGSNAVIDVTGKGYGAGMNGPGSSGTSGAYGGCGGNKSSIRCYGSIVAPTNLGSSAWGTSGGGSGGGAIRLMVAGTVWHEGLMAANGSSGGWYMGSGGSIWLTAGALVGTGGIQANGGVPSGHSGGGGGRISLVVTNEGADFSTYTGAIQAYTRGPLPGGAGTVYLCTAAQRLNEGTLIVDNGGVDTGANTEITSNVTDSVVGNVLLRKGSYLLLCTNQSLMVGGIWSNGASFVSQSGSQIIFAGGSSSTSTVYGTNTFMGLTCTNAGKTLLFATNAITSVAAGGVLTWRGSETATNLFLRSASPGKAWKLNVSASASQVVWNVDVQDSNASNGTEVVAINSMNSGRNTNWVFSSTSSDTTNVWTGAGNRMWSQGTNWSFGRAPLSSDSVKIPLGLGRYPVLDSSKTMNDLTLESSAMLSLNGYNLTVSGNATLAGGLVCTGSEHVTFYKDVDFTGGSFTAAYSTVELAGNAAQVIYPAGLNYYKVSVLNTNTVTFENGFSAYELLCSPASNELRSLVFKETETFTLNSLALLSAVGTTNITLSSAAPGTAWILKVAGPHSVRGVDVSDSDAGGGQTIYASGSLNRDNNANWNFDANWSEWTGQTGNGQFGSASNWWPVAVPGAGSRVHVDVANSMIITGAVSILNLTVGGGAGMAVVTGNAPLSVSGDMVVLRNGMLILNRPSVASNVDVLAGGLLTHSDNTTSEVNKLTMTVLGNVWVDTNGAVDVTGKGYGLSAGPGAGAGGAYGASYGGRGGGAPGASCYGSIVAPTNIGSGGGGVCPGGGAIKLMVAGTIRHDGLMAANGGGTAGYYMGSGGSIYLHAGTLIGSGSLQANGGDSTGFDGGGGGRVALVVTNAGADFSTFTGAIQARGSSGGANPTGGGAGTIYKQCAAEQPGRGTVLVDNNGQAWGGVTDVPPSTNYVAGEADRVIFYVTNAATLRLVNDFSVGDVYVPSANAKLDLGCKSLLVHARQHALGSGTVNNWGEIIWTPDVAGTVFSVR